MYFMWKLNSVINFRFDINIDVSLVKLVLIRIIIPMEEINKSTQINISGNTMFWKSNFKKPHTRFWKRYYNKKVRHTIVE